MTQMSVFSTSQLSKPLFTFSEYRAAVKALAFHPTQPHMLASGSGSADRCIRSFNLMTNEMMQCIDTGSQVCSLMFSRTTQELVSSHGFPHNHLAVWSWPSLQPLASLTGHTCRALFTTMSPCGQFIASGAADDTLRFWNVFPAKSAPSNQQIPQTYMPR